MGPTRLTLSKPVIAAIEGHAVAGGLELALWCDLRVAADDAVLGVYCRRFGVPLVDVGTVRLPRLIGAEPRPRPGPHRSGRGRPRGAGHGLGQPPLPARPGPSRRPSSSPSELAALPQTCMRNDRRSAIEQWGLSEHDAAVVEARLGREVLSSGESMAGAQRFSSGEGHGGAAL